MEEGEAEALEQQDQAVLAVAVLAETRLAQLLERLILEEGEAEVLEDMLKWDQTAVVG